MLVERGSPRRATTDRGHVKITPRVVAVRDGATCESRVQGVAPSATVTIGRRRQFPDGFAPYLSDPGGFVSVEDHHDDCGEDFGPLLKGQSSDEENDVNETAVIGVPHADLGEGLVAVICPLPGAVVNPDAVIAQLKTQLAGFKVPRRIFTVDSLPRNAMGKVQKNVWQL